MIPPAVPIARELAEIPKYDAITKRNRTGNYATTEFSAANRIVYSAQQYQNDMNVAIERQASAQTAGVNQVLVRRLVAISTEPLKHAPGWIKTIV